MGSLQRILTSDFNYTDICSAECYSSDEYCISDCFNFCFLTCPNRLPPFPPFSPHNNLPRRFIIAAVVLGITVFSLVCLTVYYKFYSGYCIRRRRGELDRIDEGFVDADRGPVVDHPIWYINTVGLESSVIDSISVCRFKKGEGIVEGSDCSVCLSEFEEDERLRLLPKCGHAFHISCIDTWLRSHTNCPLCRAPIVVQNPSPESSNSDDHSREEMQTERTEDRGESSESRDGEMRIEIEDEDRRKRMELEEEGFQPLRRSISLDAVSAFKISQAVKESEPSAPKRIGGNPSLTRLMSGSSVGRTLQIGPSSLKRSISCSGKLFLQRYSRNSSSSRSYVLPL